MELTRKQQETKASRSADQSAYASYFAKLNAADKIEEKSRNRRYLDLRLAGLSVDDAYETLCQQLGLRQISGLEAYEDEYNCNESLEDVVRWHG